MHEGRVAIWLLLAANLASAAACPVSVTAPGELAFACVSAADCLEGQVCADNVCQATASEDAARVDAVSADAQSLDAAHADAVRDDAARADAAGSDAARPDAGPGDLFTADRVSGDRAPVDAAIADASPADATLTDSAQTDVPAADTTTADASATDACSAPGAPTWWEPAYAVRFPLDVGAAPARYTIEIALSGDAASAVFGASLAAGADLRLVHHTGGATELDRDLVAFDADSVVLRFRIQEGGAGYQGGTGAYFLYVANAAAAAAPADLTQVYVQFEDFEGFVAGESGAPQYSGLPEGAWSVVDDGGNMVYQATGGGRMTLEFVGRDQLDVAIEARVKYHLFSWSTDWAALQFRGSDMDLVTYTTYAGGMHRSNAAAQIRTWNTSSGSGVLDQTSFAPSEGTWYQVSVRAVGPSSTLFVDGVQQATIGSTWTDGQIIGLTANNTTARFDDVKVRMAQDPEPQVQLGAIEQRCP